MLEVNAREQDGINIVEVSGRVVYETENDFRKAILDLISADKVKIVLNLSKLSYINSSGLGILINLLKTSQNKGGDIKLAGLQGELRELFSITSLDQIFSIYPTEEEAIKAFS
jgi:anti-sigma B factor antagonist